jgi:prephenate dehydratase
MRLEKGMCRYGVLPLENSLAGSVTDVINEPHEGPQVLHRAVVQAAHSSTAAHRAGCGA